MSQLPLAGSNPTLSPTATLILAVFTTPTSTFEPTHPATPLSIPTATATETATLAPSPTNSPILPATSLPEANPTRADEAVAESPTATATAAFPEVALPTPAPTPPSPASELDFALRWVRLRTNEENSWDGALGPGQCGSDHSIYVHVADAQENLLNDILIGDKYGNFEVPTGVDGAGKVRILVWSAAMEVAVMGHKDGTRYTSDFTPPLSTLDEQIPLDWLQQAGYCNSPEDCQWRVENNQLCRGHYSYDVVFQRTW
ncbi:MAG TPA: hypothetical protein VEC96_02530 [Anaerolineae bacterium]|nr:hypothetical protein [Anaerolineae bacterium]